MAMLFPFVKDGYHLCHLLSFRDFSRSPLILPNNGWLFCSNVCQYLKCFWMCGIRPCWFKYTLLSVKHFLPYILCFFPSNVRPGTSSKQAPLPGRGTLSMASLGKGMKRGNPWSDHKIYAFLFFRISFIHVFLFLNVITDSVPAPSYWTFPCNIKNQ